MKSGLLERALDMLDHALLIVDEAAGVHYRNRLASALLKSEAAPLMVSAGILGARGRELQAELHQAIRLACLQRRPSAVVASQGARTPLRLMVAPMDSAGAREAAVWILAPQSPRLPDPRLLAVLFGLSRAEARLALRLLAGHTPQALGDDCVLDYRGRTSHWARIFFHWHAFSSLSIGFHLSLPRHSTAVILGPSG